MYLTLTEKATLNNPYFLFEFISNDTGNRTYITADDYSGNTLRFNCFTFSEGTASGATAGGFSLIPGTYDYQVWETEYQYNILVGSASNIVEIGLMQVVGTAAPYNPIYDDTDEDTEYVYNG